MMSYIESFILAMTVLILVIYPFHRAKTKYDERRALEDYPADKARVNATEFNSNNNKSENLKLAISKIKKESKEGNFEIETDINFSEKDILQLKILGYIVSDVIHDYQNDWSYRVVSWKGSVTHQGNKGNPVPTKDKKFDPNPFGEL